MKHSICSKSISVFFLLLLVILQSYANEEKKTVSRSFVLERDTKVIIENKYGNVVINRWDKNELELKVEIEAEGKNDEKTREILEAIRIDISDRISSGSLSIKTKIGDIKGNSSFNIDYEVTMPDSNPMSLSNSFGGIYMSSFKGNLDVDMKYGQFQAEDLDNAEINVEFSSSKCEIENLKSGKLNLRYSKMAIEDMGDIEINSQFSELEIENAGMLQLDGRYGKFEIENLISLEGDIQFSGLDIERLEGSLRLESRHGDGINLEEVSNKFNLIDIESQFSSIDIRLESGASTQLAFDLQFGNLRAYGDGINFSRVNKDHNTSEYEGYLGSSNATSSIKVITRHGNIRFQVN